jgi:FAD/FMN-containing dehydrogenase
MNLTGWGRYPRIETQGFSFGTIEHLIEYLHKPQDYIAHGLGRSYGDSALNQRVIFTRRFDKILEFDPQTGIIACESGVSLAALIDSFLPRGWFLSVTPGTKFVTVGGAIASDVHGKNHHKVGCFSESVLALDLMLPDGQVLHCNREENRELFLATCGGMGLTGIILGATLRLQPVKSAYIRETIIRSHNLEEIFHLFEENQAGTYSVAWIDCLAKGDQLGRSVLMLGEHSASGQKTLPSAKTLSIPIDLPGYFLNRYSVSWFNHFYYQRSPVFVEGRLVPLETFFYPLDRIGNWNRMYGRKGFTQYQMVLPKEASFAGLQAIINKIAEAGLGPFLGVLKLFGPENKNYLSFPLEGYTLALDFKIQDRLFPLLNELDRIVVDYGGRLYLTKDVRMSQEVFRKSYPRWEQFAELRERYGMSEKFNSLQSKRLGV